MIYGYARVSTIDQNPELQEDALRAAGCHHIFIEHASGASRARPQLVEVLAKLEKGDVLTVWRLDRLGRSLQHLIEIVNELHARGVEFRCLVEGFDTTTASGMMLFQIFGSFAEYERRLISERTRAGLDAARRRGVRSGRPPVGPDRRAAIRELAMTGKGNREIARALGIDEKTVRNYLAENPPAA
jgi:DNA invertase Pin-like site-specific DNA recombinase